jgi:hypothetical protein
MYRTRPMMSGDVELDRLLKFVDAIINAGVQREVEAELSTHKAIQSPVYERTTRAYPQQSQAPTAFPG